VGSNGDYKSWHNFLAPYVQWKGLIGESQILHCTEFVNKDIRNARWGSLWPRSYGYNAFGTGALPDPTLGLGFRPSADGPPERGFTAESAVSVPSDMILIGDISEPNSSGMGSNEFEISSPDPIYWPGLAHRRGANMVFCDGHVEFAKQTNWIAAVDSARRRWNNDNEPHPQTW
jgi:prepilin-type processing-associated H-X9-DG protein